VIPFPFPDRRRISSVSLVLAAALAACVVGCGSSTGDTGGADSGQRDGGATDTGLESSSKEGGGDAADGSAKYPAFPVDYPQVLKNTDAILDKPVIVTVSWPAQDSSVATWEAFDDDIGASSFWSATTSQYGVAAASSGAANHVRMTQPLPKSLSYTQLQAFVVAEVAEAEGDAGLGDAGADGGPPNPKWPAPTVDSHGNVQTLYSLFIPEAVAVTDPGSGMPFCQEGGLGYHDSVQTTSGGPWIPYAVNLNCAPFGVPGVEETAAHETVEGATNPYTESMTVQGYIGFDPDHLAWELYTGFNDELCDACENWQDSYFEETGSFPFWIQACWSNEAALAGHDPCAPAPTGPYHGMTLFPSEEQTVSINLASVGGTTSSTKGFNVTIGKPLVFHVGFFSDAPTAPWTIAYDFETSLDQLFDTSFNPYDNGTATVTIDQATGQNGDMATVTVTPTKKGEGSFQVLAITWDPPTMSGYLPHYLPIVLVDQ
jgi:hypothetical protein